MREACWAAVVLLVSPPFRAIWCALLSENNVAICWPRFELFPWRLSSSCLVCGRFVAREYEPISNVCSSCRTQELASVGKWVVRADDEGRRTPPNASCDSRVDKCFASPLGFLVSGSPAPLRCHACSTLDAANRREAAIYDCKTGCGPTLVCKDIFSVCPRMAALRRRIFSSVCYGFPCVGVGRSTHAERLES